VVLTQTRHVAIATHMAKEKTPTLSVKLHMDVIESARIVAACRNESMTDLLSDILRPVVARLEQEEIAKRTRPPESPKKGGRS
jgi:hypothetical protein